MKFIAMGILLFTANSFAYKPTVESLFRNGSNGEIGQNTVVANFLLKRKVTEAQSSDETLKSLPNEFSYKLIFGNEKKRPKMVQVNYAGPTISSSKMIDVSYYPAVSFSGLRLKNEDVEKKFFYSLMLSLVNNQGYLMVELLKDIGVGVQSNRERIDKEQLYYLGQYMNYLKTDTEEENKENPLAPENPEAQEKLKEIFKRPFLTPSSLVKRVKEGNEFFWEIRTDKIFARFSHDDHKLLEVELKTENGIINAKCFNYILYGKEMQFPEMVLLKDLNGDEYILNMKKVTNFTDQADNFIKRITEYKKSLQENETEKPILRLSFTL